MAVFRKIHVTFWEDSFVETLTPEEKFFYLFLMTNPRTTESGIYEITIKKMSDLTGYNKETIEKLLKKFIAYKKVLYNYKTSEIALLNKPRYINRLGKPMVDCLNSELSKVKDKTLIEELSKSCENELLRGIYDTPTLRYTSSGQEKEEEEEKEEEKQGKKFVKPSIDEVREYANSINYDLDASLFIDSYEAKGWLIGKNRMKDWKAAVRTWQKRNPKPLRPEYQLSETMRKVLGK